MILSLLSENTSICILINLIETGLLFFDKCVLLICRVRHNIYQIFIFKISLFLIFSIFSYTSYLFPKLQNDSYILHLLFIFKIWMCKIFLIFFFDQNKHKRNFYSHWLCPHVNKDCFLFWLWFLFFQPKKKSSIFFQN